MRPGALVVLVCAAASFAAVPAGAVVTECNVAIPMSDGIELYANVRRPDGPGPFPTILTATGYNKDAGAIAGSCGTVGGSLVDEGYAAIMLDDRGTGASEGKWDSWGERTQQDYEEVLDWIQAQAWSNGKVGTTGASYMGVTSLLLAQADARRRAEQKPRAVFAIWADVPMADAYRDVTIHGGNPDTGFMPLWLGLTHSLSILPPSNLGSDPDALVTWADHIRNVWDFGGQNVASATLEEDWAFDGPHYRVRSPASEAHTIDVPVAWVGGWFDLFQRGEPLLHELLTASPKRVMWMMPIYHVGGQDTWIEQGIGSRDAVKSAWWDCHLRGNCSTNLGGDDQNPVMVPTLPSVNLYKMGENAWHHGDAWPLPGVEYTDFFFTGTPDEGDPSTAVQAAGGLDSDAGPAGQDRMLFLPAGGVCNRSTAQWTAGAGAYLPCETDNRLAETLGVTYTSEPLDAALDVTGHVVADFWVEMTNADAAFVTTVSVVRADGSSEQLTAGWLNASHRAVDLSKSTCQRSSLFDSRVRFLTQTCNPSLLFPVVDFLRPWHPHTREAQEPVTPNDPIRLQVDVFPTSYTFQPGERIRVTITTADQPHLATPAPALARMAGGDIRILRGPEYPSRIQLPVVP